MGEMACCRPGTISFWCWDGTPVGEGGGSVHNWCSPEGTLFWREIHDLRMDSELFDQLSDLNCFDLWCNKGMDDISSLCDSPGVFPQKWLHLPLSYMWLLEVTGFTLINRCVSVQSQCQMPQRMET